MKSGMVAAEALFDHVVRDNADPEVIDYGHGLKNHGCGVSFTASAIFDPHSAAG